MTLPTIKTTRLTENAMLRALWHKSRKCAVPLTARELTERFSCSPDLVRTIAEILIAKGKLKKEQSNCGKFMIYELTLPGALLARSIAEVQQ